MSRALGGLTGDCYGAINEVTEAAVLTAMTALIWRRWLEPLPNLLDRF
jgi:cobalamin synthase